MVQTYSDKEFFFERGPRTFMASKGKPLLDLIEEMGLTGDIIYSDKSSNRKYFTQGNTLVPFSKAPGIYKALLTEWYQKPKFVSDESVYDFFLRRIGSKLTESIIASMAVGIYAGDIKKLSMEMCFPSFRKMEQTYGSLTKAMLNKKGKKDSRLFTLKSGLASLIEALSKRCDITYNADITALKQDGDKITMTINGHSETFDKVYSTIPLKEISHLAGLETLLLPTVDITTVNVAYKSQVLDKKGFGFLSTNGSILGVVFDSQVFPEQNRFENETRLTVMMQKPSFDKAIAALSTYLNITKEPDAIYSTEHVDAIYHPPVHFKETLVNWLHKSQDMLPGLIHCGTYLGSPSIISRVSPVLVNSMNDAMKANMAQTISGNCKNTVTNIPPSSPANA